jgi:FixJ family two-component response regulator
MSQDETLVYVVDDDHGVRDSLSLLLRSVGIKSAAYASAKAFLEAYESDRVACLVADIRMPGMSGLDLQRELKERDIDLPIIFITGHGDVPMAVNAMKSGALDFLQKPFRDQDLLDRINKALKLARDHQATQIEEDEIRRRLDSLTPRESEVMGMVVKGCANKVIAMDLGVSQRTVELHRARVMHKMGVRSLAELVRLAERVRTAD